MAGMADRRPLNIDVMCMLIVIVAAGGLMGSVVAQSPPPSSGCTSSIVSLSPCLSYVTGSNNASAPAQGCCTALSSFVKTSANCLCQLVTSNNPLGFPINRTLALSLPGACKINTPPLSQCKAAAGAPATAPVASPATAPVASPASSPVPSTKGSIPAPEPSIAKTPSPVVGVPKADSPADSTPSNTIPPTTSDKGGNAPSSLGARPHADSGAASFFTPSIFFTVCLGLVLATMV
eukprot:Gb_02458 [translate_table: standard]